MHWTEKQPLTPFSPRPFDVSRRAGKFEVSLYVHVPDAGQRDQLTAAVRAKSAQQMAELSAAVGTQLQESAPFVVFARCRDELRAAERAAAQHGAQLAELQARRRSLELSDAPKLAEKLLKLDKDMETARAGQAGWQAQADVLRPLLAERRTAADLKMRALVLVALKGVRDGRKAEQAQIFQAMLGKIGAELDALVGNDIALEESYKDTVMLSRLGVLLEDLPAAQPTAK